MHILHLDCIKSTLMLRFNPIIDKVPSLQTLKKHPRFIFTHLDVAKASGVHNRNPLDTIQSGRPGGPRNSSFPFSQKY